MDSGPGKINAQIRIAGLPLCLLEKNIEILYQNGVLLI